MERFKRVLLPTAFADLAKLVAPYVRDLARAFESQVHVVHIIEPPMPVPVAEGMTVMPTVLPAREELLSQAQNDIAQFVRSELADCGDVHTAVLFDNVADGLVEYAVGHNIDLIIMSTHARGIWHRLFRGSVGESVLEKARCPVLLIPIRA